MKKEIKQMLKEFFVSFEKNAEMQERKTDKHPVKNRTMMQMFEWYLPEDGKHWERIATQAEEIAGTGINMVWLPPAYKGQKGMEDVGYGVYDTYDLGEFDQKGSVSTKYGTKDAYLQAIQALHRNKVEVLGDIVLNHRMGADATEEVYVSKMSYGDRTYSEQEHRLIRAWTKFTFPGRNGKYSQFQWNASHFTSVDYDDKTHENGVFLFEGKSWDEDVDDENRNYDYLMGADLDLQEQSVFDELVRFGKWYYDLTGMDGFRLDAVKHMCAGFYRDWVNAMREYTGKEMFTVGEYWSSELKKLRDYISRTEGAFSLFDVPLHMHFHQISVGNASFDMAQLFKDTLTGCDSWHSVTFVDNHDTQPGQALGTYVSRWFKEIAYAIILLQERGIPCVFYGDYYGIPNDNLEPVWNLKKLIHLRSTHAYGTEHDYYDHFDIVGFTREGDCVENGLALLCSDGPGGSKRMYVGKQHAGQIYVDALGHRKERITISEDGCADFYVEGGSVSVWIPEII